MERIYRGAWVLPIVGEAIPEGAVAVDGETVEAFGPADLLLREAGNAEVVDMPGAVLLPGLVNAHTHLGLTDESGRHPAGAGLLPWLKSLVPAARDLEEKAVVAAARRGIAESWRLGTDLLGDVVSHPAVLEAAREHPAMLARLYFEFLGVREPAARESLRVAHSRARAVAAGGNGRIRPGLSPHAPYSVWPALWREAAHVAEEEHFPLTTHLAEPPGEREFLERGTGPLREYLEWLGAWDGTFPVPGIAGTALLEREGCLDEITLLVHGLHLDTDEMGRLAVNDAALALCPRSNAWLGLPPPPVEDLLAAGVFLCLGTDSKASNHDLGVWGEMRALKRLAPGLPDAMILRMATAHGAMALGFAGDAGVLRPGGRARLIAVTGNDGPDPHAFLVHERVEDAVVRLEPRETDPLRENAPFC